MKKYCILAATLMASICAYPQHETGSLTIQPKIGLNVANYTDEEDSDPRIGLVLGGEMEYQISPKTGLSIGILYSAQGAKGSGYVEGAKVRITSRTDYLNIPILANIYVYKGLALKFGFQPAFNVVSDYVMASQGVEIKGSLADIGVKVRSFDFAIPLGISYEYKNFVIDGRYNFGCVKIIDGKDTKNSVFQFTVGYKLSL